MPTLQKLSADLFNTVVVESTIATSGTVGTEAYMGECRLVAIECPAELEGTTLTFQAGTRTGDLRVLIDGNSEAGDTVSVIVAASRFVRVDPSLFAGCVYIKPVAGSTQTTTPTVLRLVGQVL